MITETNQKLTLKFKFQSTNFKNSDYTISTQIVFFSQQKNIWQKHKKKN